MPTPFRPDAQLRDARLRRLVAHAWERVPHYRRRFRAAGVDPADICSASSGRRVIRRGLVLGLALAAGVPAPGAGQEAAPLERPRIAVALSGGGARGIAHVGVLEVLEELRVPVDLITGTSMGAIVGGLYASGLPADSIRMLVTRADWEAILADTPPRPALDFPHRARQHRYGVEIEVRLSRAGLTLPRGLISGQELGLLLRRATLPVATVDEFARLPIPFAAVATDIATIEPVVLDRGDLVEAMRASMAIPVAVAPVERDGRLLVDGGLADDLPVDLAREMGADVVIAVDVTPPLLRPEEIKDLLGVTRQVARGLGRQGVEAQRASADLVLDPVPEEIGVFDFRQMEEILALGVSAARAAADSLSAWALPTDAYQAHRSARSDRRPPPPAALSGVRIDAPAWFDDRLALAGIDPQLFRRFDADLVERAADRIHAMGEIERVGYDIAPAPGAPLLVLDVHDKPHGPHLLLFGIDLVLDSAGEAPPRVAFDGVAAYLRTRIGARAAEWHVEARVGTTTGVETAFRQPLDFAGRWFVEPSALAIEVERPVLSGEASGTEYDSRHALIGLDIGRTLGLSGEIRLGVRGGRESSELDPASPGLADRFPTVAEDAAELRASLVVDRLDAVGIPRRGVYASATARASREELGAERTWATAAIDGRAYWSRGPHTVFARGAAGGASPAERLPVHEEFLLGGFGSLAGHADGELRGEAFAVARAGWLRRVAEVPPAFRAVVAGAWVEGGDAWEPSLDEEFDARLAVTAAVGVETLLGPIFLAWSRSEGGRGRLTLSLGRSP